MIAPVLAPSLSADERSGDENLFSLAPLGLCQLALDGRILRVNNKLQTLYGLDEDQLTVHFFSALLHPEEINLADARLNDLAIGHGEYCEFQSRLRHARGHVTWVSITLSLLRDSRGQAVHYIVGVVDINEQKLAEQIAHREHDKLTAITDQAPVAVWIFSPARHLLFVNDAQEALSGRSKEKLYANPNSYLELIHPDDSEHVEKILQARQYGESYAMNYRILRDDGEIRYVRELGKSICDTNGNLLYHITSAMDISSELLVRDELHELNSRLREANLRLRESVRLDGLTRCLNRTALFDEAEKALLLERRYERSSTLVFFDLNNFKEVNDNFGHHVGDRGLIAFAEQIKARLRTTDELGRYGGDEFVALLRETDADQAMQLLATLPPVVVDDENGSSIILRFSAGVACSSEPDIDTVDDWLRIADGQMYNQKVRFLKENGGRG
ncbi:MAG TPA: diguanylate cyclase [Spongiibacteraceae bacterium]